MPADSSDITKVAWQEPLLDLLDSIVSNKKVFFSIMTLGMLIGIVRLIMMPYQFESSAVAVLLTREKAVVDAAIDTGSVEATDYTAVRSSAGNLMLPPDPTLYSTIILSRAVLTQIAEKHGELLDGEISDRDRSAEVINHLRRMITVTTTEEGIIKIKVVSNKPELSAAIAISMFEECGQVSRSIERKLLINQADHLDKANQMAQDRLRRTEQKIGQLAEKYGLIDTDLQASNQLRSLRDLNAKRDQLDTDLHELLVSHTEDSREVKAMRARIDAVLRQINNSSKV